MSIQRSFYRAVLRAMKLCLCVVLLLILSGPTLAASGRLGVDEQLLEAEQILSGLGYWVLKIDGIADASTRHAITAFQKVVRRMRVSHHHPKT